MSDRRGDRTGRRRWTRARAWTTGLALLAGTVAPLSAATPAAAQDSATAYVTNSASDSVDVIDGGGFRRDASIHVGDHPIGVDVHPNGTRVYVTNANDDNVSVIDTATNTVIGNPIRVGDDPESVVFSPNGSRAYVANTGAGTVSVIDTATSSVSATVTVAGYPRQVAVTPNGALVYATTTDVNGNGSVTVINTANNATLTIPLGMSPDGVAFTPDSLRAYVTGIGRISVINTLTSSVIKNISSDGLPAGVSVQTNPQGSTFVYVNDSMANTVTVLDPATDNIVNVVDTGSRPLGSGSDAFDAYIWTTNIGDGTVTVISTVGRTPGYATTLYNFNRPQNVAFGVVPETSQAQTALTLRAERNGEKDGPRLRHPDGVALSAKLTSGGRPVEGKDVTFTAGTNRLCTDATDARGRADCKAKAGREGETCYSAAFAGDRTHGPSTATACTRSS